MCARANETHTQRAADTGTIDAPALRAQPRSPHEPASDSARRFDAGVRSARRSRDASTNRACGVYTHSPPRFAIAHGGALAETQLMLVLAKSRALRV
ncbi:hypothetical protein C8J57DRAFT_1491670 [Mycena rebaudengoi]|nr:hypothetical protein C8J57DRAFT_1491670 [Mycena rebaudengoi]